MFKCPFCENFSYDWDDNWDYEKKSEIVKQVSSHINNHPESLTTKPEETNTTDDNIDTKQSA
jgi:hypothetical protein